MKGAVRFLLFGIGVWLIPFVIGMIIFPVAPPDSALFDTLMSVAMSVSAGGMSYAYLRRLDRPNLPAGIAVGLGWAVLAVALDAPLFLFGPFLMPAAAYFADIGLSYLMIPAIAGCIGLALDRSTA